MWLLKVNLFTSDILDNFSGIDSIVDAQIGADTLPKEVTQMAV